jgi:hypothetical protein
VSTVIIMLMVLGGGLLVASLFLLLGRHLVSVQRRSNAIRQEQLMFEQRLRHLTQLAVSAMRAEARRHSHDA